MSDSLKIVRYRDQNIKVGMDDSAQCYYFIYKGKSYGCGTYNEDYLSELISVVDADLDDTFYVKSEKPHRPSSKVYKRYDIWYCDYQDFDGMILSYGKLNDENPSKQELVDRAHSLMNRLDEIINNIEENKI